MQQEEKPEDCSLIIKGKKLNRGDLLRKFTAQDQELKDGRRELT